MMPASTIRLDEGVCEETTRIATGNYVNADQKEGFPLHRPGGSAGNGVDQADAFESA